MMAPRLSNLKWGLGNLSAGLTFVVTAPSNHETPKRSCWLGMPRDIVNEI